jgi:hypothetical protein
MPHRPGIVTGNPEAAAPPCRASLTLGKHFQGSFSGPFSLESRQVPFSSPATIFKGSPATVVESSSRSSHSAKSTTRCFSPFCRVTFKSAAFIRPSECFPSKPGCKEAEQGAQSVEPTRKAPRGDHGFL